VEIRVKWTESTGPVTGFSVSTKKGGYRGSARRGSVG